jgi:hypothetical protein
MRVFETGVRMHEHAFAAFVQNIVLGYLVLCALMRAITME